MTQGCRSPIRRQSTTLSSVRPHRVPGAQADQAMTPGSSTRPVGHRPYTRWITQADGRMEPRKRKTAPHGAVGSTLLPVDGVWTAYTQPPRPHKLGHSVARVIAYIDGFNLYYGLHTKYRRRYLWLDLEHLVQRMRRNDEIVAI